MAGIVFQEDQFFRLVLFGMRAAAKEAGVELLEGNSYNKPEKEIELVNTYVAQGVDAILISPLMVLSKKRQHYLTVGYEAEDGRQQAMLLKVDKGHIRAILVSLEARTGRKVSYQDEEARKAGKG